MHIADIVWNTWQTYNIYNGYTHTHTDTYTNTHTHTHTHKHTHGHKLTHNPHHTQTHNIHTQPTASLQCPFFPLPRSGYFTYDRDETVFGSFAPFIRIYTAEGDEDERWEGVRVSATVCESCTHEIGVSFTCSITPSYTQSSVEEPPPTQLDVVCKVCIMCPSVVWKWWWQQINWGDRYFFSCKSSHLMHGVAHTLPNAQCTNFLPHSTPPPHHPHPIPHSTSHIPPTPLHPMPVLYTAGYSGQCCPLWRWKRGEQWFGEWGLCDQF